jgi:hypothetical protein
MVADMEETKRYEMIKTLLSDKLKGAICYCATAERSERGAFFNYSFSVNRLNNRAESNLFDIMQIVEDLIPEQSKVKWEIR